VQQDHAGALPDELRHDLDENQPADDLTQREEAARDRQRAERGQRDVRKVLGGMHAREHAKELSVARRRKWNP
jgi:hypothetical protein